MAKSNIPDEEVQRALKYICDHFDIEDRPVRERQIRIWKKLKYYWVGIEKFWWSETAHDWRVYDVEQSQSPDDNAFYDKPVNVFRAYLESIIAALSVTVPSIKCYPDDADNSLDLDTAKAGDKIAELVYKHNNAPLLWLHALYIFCTEGLIAAYSYPKEDESYGTFEEPDYEDTEEEQTVPYCPICNSQLDESFMARERDEFMPDDSDVELHDLLASGKDICPACAAQIDPELRREKVVVTRITGVTSKPKTRQCIEVYGGLFVKVPVWARNQVDCPYLKFAYETHFSNILAKYPHLQKKYKKEGEKISSASSGNYDLYERWGRLSTQYNGDYPLNNPTVNTYWLRPSSFTILSDPEMAKRLKKMYPDGCKVVHINEDFAEARNEALDDCWTLSQNPLSDYLHHDPLGLLLTSLQDITNDLVSLILQTIEHGIPQTFADPSVLNFEQYRQTEVAAGMIFPAKPAPGKAIGDAFYEIKTASLSPEVEPFANKVQEYMQLVSGALPSLFGGPAPNSSKTAAQYSMSRAQALQRLQTPWKMLTFWWKDIFSKVIPSYIKDAAYDERLVEKDDTGNFVNVFIRHSQLAGKIGSVELEASENLPITWSQKKDVIMQLLQAGNPLIMQALSAPENVNLVKDAIGLNDFEMPGEDDREKQYEEINLLVNSEPITSPGMDGQPQQTPSVDVEPLVDNNDIHAEICRNWAVSPAGRLSKIENPSGYQNVLLHMKRHVDISQAMMAMQSSQGMMQGAPPMNAATQGSSPNSGNGKENSQNKPQIPTPAAAKVTGNVTH